MGVFTKRKKNVTLESRIRVHSSKIVIWNPWNNWHTIELRSNTWLTPARTFIGCFIISVICSNWSLAYKSNSYYWNAFSVCLQIMAQKTLPNPNESREKEGDLLEINRGAFCHWAVYIGMLQLINSS